MIVSRSAVLVITDTTAVRKHAAALFRREKLILLQVCLTGRHLVFTFLRRKSLEFAALVILPIRQETSIDSFKRSVKTYLFKKAFSLIIYSFNLIL